MEDQHPDLIKDVNIQKRRLFINNILSLNNWYITVFGTIIFYLTVTGITVLTGISLSPKDYPVFIDQRSSNLATIGGMCLTVITFLMSNIAVKEPYAYKLLFTSTKMYAAIFFVLTSLGCFVMVSTLRNNIPAAYYPYFVISSSFVFLTVLVVIGYLFSRALYYTNPKQIDEFMNRELQLNASIIILHGLMKKYSLDRYQAVLGQQAAIPYLPRDHFKPSWFTTPTIWMTSEEVVEIEKKQKYVLDINMVLLANYLQRTEKPVYYHNLAFNELTDQSDHYIFRTEIENSREEKKALRDILYLTSQGIVFSPVLEIREHFDEKMILYSEKGQIKELQRILKGLTDIFNLQALHQLLIPFDLTQDFLEVLRKSIAVSVKENKYDCFAGLVVFFYNHSQLAIKEKNRSLFSDFLNLNIFVYYTVIERKGNPAYEQILNLGLSAEGFYQDFFFFLSKMEQEKNEKKTQASIYAKIIYQSFSHLMFYMVNYKDYTGLKRAVKLLEGQFGIYSDFSTKMEIERLKTEKQDNDTYRAIKILKINYQESKQPQVFRQHAMFGIKSWIFYLLQSSTISTIEAIEMTKSMIIRYVDSMDPLEDIFFIRSGAASLGYFGWGSWVPTTDDEDEDNNIMDPTYWLTFGFMAEQIIQFSLPYITDELDVEEFQYIGVLKEQLQAIKAKLDDDFGKWKDVLKIKDLNDLKVKSQKVIDYFELLELKKDSVELKRIADAHLEVAIVKQETEAAQKAWGEHAHIFKLFKDYNLVKVSGSSLNFVGQQGYVPKYKSFFIEKRQDLNILPTFSSALARDMDEDFFRTAIQGAELTGSSKTLSEVFVEGLAMLKQKEMNPEYIMIEASNRYMDDTLTKHEDFRPNPGSETRSSPLLFGWYRSIPIYMFHNVSLINRVLIAEGSRAFELEYEEFPERYEKILDVSLSEVTDIEAREIFDKKDFTNISTKEKEEEISSIKNGIIMSIGANYQFKILNNFAYFVGTIA